MASISERNGTWRVHWRGPDRKQRTKTFQRKTDAKAYASTVEADLVRGVYIDPGLGKKLFGEYATDWASAQEWRPSTREQVESHLRVHILPAFGHRPIGTITRTDVQKFVSERSGEYSATTVEGLYSRLASIFKSATLDGLIQRTPCNRISRPSSKLHGAAKVVAIDFDEVAGLAEAVSPWLRGFVWLLAGSGLRPGEGAGLTVDRVDFDRLEVNVDRQLLTPSGGEMHLGPPKTAESVRTVPIPDALAEHLTRHLDEYPAQPFGSDLLMFTSRTGHPLRRATLGSAWRAAADRCNLRPDARGWHSLRHTYASLLIEAGLSVRAVQARLGHTSATETLNTYSHLWRDSEEETREAVGRAFPKVSGTSA